MANGLEIKNEVGSGTVAGSLCEGKVQSDWLDIDPFLYTPD